VTQEFFISVTPVRENDFIVRTEGVAMGVPLAEEVVSWPVDRWLTQAAHVMHDPLVGLLRGNRSGIAVPTDPTTAGDLVALGQDLYNAIFQGTIRDSWMIAQGVAQNQKQILRLRLGLKDDRLPLLPWEVLHDGARPLATNTDVVFSRYRSTFSGGSNARTVQLEGTPDRPLRILMVLAAPTDQEVLQLHQEAAHLQAELQRELPNGNGATDASRLELTILDQPGREQLTQALEQGHYDILHYAGHSDLSAGGGDLYLVSNRTGLTEVLNGDDLAGLLVNNGVRMAVFNSCQGVYTATASESGVNTGSLSDALLKRGVPAVLAMAERIPDEVALNLSRLFYRNLKQGCPIDLGLSRARQGLLSSYGSDQPYWALPILYLQSEFDGYLQAQQRLAGLSNELESSWEQDYEPLPVGLGPIDESVAWDEVDYPPTDEDLGLVAPNQNDRGIIQSLLKELEGNPVAGSDTGLPLNPGTRADDPRQADAEDFNRLGQQLYAQGDWSGAIGAYGDALKLNPESAVVYNNLGEALEKYGSLPEALTAYKMALQLEPDLPSAKQNLERMVYGLSEPAMDLSVQPPQSPVEARSTAPQKNIYGDAKTPTKRPPAANSNNKLKTALTLGVTAAVLGSLWFVATRPQGNNGAPNLPIVSQSGSDAGKAELQKTAMESFQQNDLYKGDQAVAQLLDQGALMEAHTALSAVPSANANSPAILFLRGRVAWEFIQREGNKMGYSIDDVRRDWMAAAKAQPNNADYQNAVAFSLYVEGNLKEANDTWLEAARLSGQKDTPNPPALLTATAGQALVAHKKSADDRKFLEKAIELRDRVTSANSAAFQRDSLAKDWRWTEPMIADWQRLLAAKR
jgi:tetratricopeptide (TPR) repeat protein